MIDEPFLSYPRDVRPVVESIAKDLRDGGLSPYFDEQLSGGQAWWEELLNKIEVCDAFMPILCQQYLDSYPCRLEAEYASRLKKHFLPIALEQLTPRFFIPAIAEAQWVTYKQGDRDSLLSLLRSLRNSAGSPDPPIPPPPRPSVPVTYLTGLRDTIVSTNELSRSQQFAVLAELKARQDGPEAADIQALLLQFRRRTDLYELVVAEIESALKSPRGKRPEDHRRGQGDAPDRENPSDSGKRRRADSTSVSSTSEAATVGRKTRRGKATRRAAAALVLIGIGAAVALILNRRTPPQPSPPATNTGVASPIITAAPTPVFTPRPATLRVAAVAYTGPSTLSAEEYALPAGAAVRIVCTSSGQAMREPDGIVTTIWDRMSTGGYMTDGDVNTGTNAAIAPPC